VGGSHQQLLLAYVMLQVAWQLSPDCVHWDGPLANVLCVAPHCNCVTVGAQVLRQHCWIPGLRDIVSVSALDEDVAFEVQDVYSSTGVRHGCWWAREPLLLCCDAIKLPSHVWFKPWLIRGVFAGSTLHTAVAPY
jgi:hypothetical protein